MGICFSRVLPVILLSMPVLALGGEMPESLGQRFEQSDRDQNRKLHRKEVAKTWPWAAKNFHRLDKDRDGHVTIAELMDKYRDTIRDSAARFQGADADRDGYLTRDEAAKLDPELARNFDAMDADRDGRVSREEYERFFNRQPAEFWEQRFVAPAQVRVEF